MVLVGFFFLPVGGDVVVVVLFGRMFLVLFRNLLFSCLCACAGVFGVTVVLKVV